MITDIQLTLFASLFLCWQLLSEASNLLPFMTDYEHGQVSRLSSILLLGFLLPHSTGNEFFLMQNVSNKSRLSSNQQSAGSQTGESRDVGDLVIQMPLEERLECASRSYNVDEFGELDTIVHETVDLAFHSFLFNALAPFMSGRPAHAQEVDLLHILAMAIHPQPKEQSIKKTADTLEDKDSDAWITAQNLMSSLVPHCFHINYVNRLKLVRLVADHLILPEYNEKTAATQTPLYEGALSHLRASLHAFTVGAMSPYDAHWAQCGVATIAIQAGMEMIVNEEWDTLFHHICDDRTDYKCTSHHHVRTPSFSLMTQDPNTFCPHTARGQLLERFLTRYNESRQYAEADFLQRSLASLTDAVEWQVHCWTKEEEGEEEEKGESQTIKDSPCMLASLLFAATPLFYFLLPILNVDDQSGNESEESHRRDMLLSKGIQLVHHWDPTIAREASLMIILAFCYGPDEMVSDYVGAVFETTKLALDDSFQEKENKRRQAQVPGQAVVAIESMVATFAQKSERYADCLLAFLLSEDHRKHWKGSTTSNEDHKAVEVFRLVAVVATASPVAALKHVDKLTEILEQKETPTPVRLHLIAALLACRRARFFAGGNTQAEQSIRKATASNTENGWDFYRLARHAMVTGNFEIAKIFYKKTVSLSSSETSFLWLSALEKVAEAEASLSANAAKGIPNATIQLNSAISSLYSLSSFVAASTADFTLQMRLLRLRLDFLDLLTTLRQLTREMRLTGSGPAKHTRSSLHLRNVVKCLDELATKYLTVYREHGLFVCQQSRTTLRSLHALCRFVARAATSTFVDSLPEYSIADFQANAIKELTLPKGDECHPMTALTKRLDTLVLKEMDSSIDPTIRAAAMLEVIDGILKAPSPFPRDFTLTKPVPLATLRVAGNRDSVDSTFEPGDAPESEFKDAVEASPGVSFTFFASGKLPESVLARAKLPFCMVLLWYTVSHQSVTHDEDNHQEEKQDEEKDEGNAPSSADVKSEPDTKSWLKSINVAPTVARLSPTGKYFMKVECQPLLDEGNYIIETRLGCRDIRCGEWELPAIQGVRTISVRVYRPRS
jgi:integrator complex subunit 7